jgi:N-acyl homoserine lactone hydrolase
MEAKMKDLKMYVLDLGRMRMDKNQMLKNSVVADSLEPNKSTEFIEFPVQAFLFEGEEGYILYDTGCHPECMENEGRWPKKTQISIPYQGNDAYLMHNRLSQLGLKPDDIAWVILSHMHCDHAGCVEFFENSKLIVHEDEFNACLQAYAMHDASNYIWSDTNVWIKRKLKWNLISQNDSDFTLTPGLDILNLGSGHSHGMLGLSVQLKNTGRIIITSDAIYCRENFESKYSEQGVIYDTIGWRNTVKRIKYLSRQYNADVWFGHDMDQFNGIKKSTEGYYD